MRSPGLLTDLADLVLARACAVCGRPGRAVCAACLARLARNPSPVSGPPGLPPIVAAVPYAGLGQQLVLRYKERGDRSLGPALGGLLAAAIRPHLRSPAPPAALVPVPSHRHAPRGFDALDGVVRASTRSLGADGIAAVVHRPLEPAAGYHPLKQLGRLDRLQQVRGAFRPRAGAPRLPPGTPVLVVDDVITTGATVGEVVRVLQDMGVEPTGISVVAAVSRGRSGQNPAPARSTPRS